MTVALFAFWVFNRLWILGLRQAMAVLGRSTSGSRRFSFEDHFPWCFLTWSEHMRLWFSRYNMGSGRRYFYSPGLNDGT